MLFLLNLFSVGDLAYALVWKCLVEDPQTFFRRFFEKITSKNKQVCWVFCWEKIYLSHNNTHPRTGLFHRIMAHQMG